MTSSDIKNPNIEVLQKLFTYRQTLLKYLKSKDSSLSDQALQDIVDHVLLSTARSDNLDLSDETKLLSYLKRICYNEMLDFKKAQYRTSSNLLDSNLSGISAPDPGELHSQRELITEAIDRIKQVSSPDEFTLFINHIQSHLDDKRVDRRSIQEKYGWSAAKLNQMTASLNMKIKLVKTQVLAVPLFLWDLPRKLLRGHASNAEAATVASSATTAGGATILSMKAVPVVLVATTIVGGGAMVYQHHDSNAKRPHIVRKPPTADRPKEVAAPPQIPVVDKQTVSKTKPSTPKPHKRRRHHRPRRLHQQQHSQPAASPSVSSKNTPPPPPSAPPPKPKPAPSPASSSKGEGDAEFGVDGP